MNLKPLVGIVLFFLGCVNIFDTPEKSIIHDLTEPITLLKKMTNYDYTLLNRNSLDTIGKVDFIKINNSYLEVDMMFNPEDTTYKISADSSYKLLIMSKKYNLFSQYDSVLIDIKIETVKNNLISEDDVTAKRTEVYYKKLGSNNYLSLKNLNFTPLLSVKEPVQLEFRVIIPRNYDVDKIKYQFTLNGYR